MVTTWYQERGLCNEEGLGNTTLVLISDCKGVLTCQNPLERQIQPCLHYYMWDYSSFTNYNALKAYAKALSCVRVGVKQKAAESTVTTQGNAAAHGTVNNSEQ